MQAICQAAAMFSRRLAPLLLCCCVAACAQADAPFARLAGVMVDEHLREVSGVAASRTHKDVLWMLNDGGNPAELYAVTRYGRRLARVRIEDTANTDWEDLSAFELDGKRYLLIADTGDNGGLRKTLQLHVVAEPRDLVDAALKPAWSIAFRWPDGARDCEAVAVDAQNKQILLLSKKRQPPELFVLPLHAGTKAKARPLTARRIGYLRGVPQPGAALVREQPQRARVYAHVTAADVSPRGDRLAVMTYNHVLIYSRRPQQSWAQAAASAPQVYPVPLIPQPEALAWSAGGGGLYATGEFSPAPIFFLMPAAKR